MPKSWGFRRSVIICMALVLSALFASPAKALDVSAKGEFLFSFRYDENGNLYGTSPLDQSRDGFHARQRMRVQVDFAVSEYLRGVYHIEIGELQWGRGGAAGRGSGGALGADGVNVETKRAFIEFDIPDTELTFRVGIQGITNPNIGLGFVLVDADAAGVSAMYRFNDAVSVTAFWTRLYDLDVNNVASKGSSRVDEMDFFALMVPIAGDGWTLTPYAAFIASGRDVFRDQGLASFPRMLSPAFAAGLSYLGQPFVSQYVNDQSHLYTWWAGATAEITMFDPFEIAVEALYGAVEAENSALDRRGLYVGAELDYKLDMLTLSLFGWYATGEDGSWRNGSEQLPTLSSVRAFGPTSFGFVGTRMLPWQGLVSASPAGMWGLRFALKDITFVEDLRHTVRFLYAQGTNDPDSRRIVGLTSPNLILGYKGSPMPVPAGYATLPMATTIADIPLTTEDSMFEINVDTYYKLFENLELQLETGMVHVNYGNDVWINQDVGTAWKAALGLKFTF